MRLVHLSDLHLGFRQYQRLTPTGINQREADVGAAFKRAIDKTIALRPDLVVVAGDVFHTVRPSNPAIVLAFGEFSKLRRALPDARVVIVGGNHDQPRSSETGCILRLFTQLGIEVAETSPKPLSFPELGLHVLAVPYTTDVPRLDHDPAARFNVLVLHGVYPGVYPARMVEERGLIEIPRNVIQPERWNYVALGHYHVCRNPEPDVHHMFYSGAIEYTGSNVWGERSEELVAGVKGKGIIEFDLAQGTSTFHPIKLERKVVDLPELSGGGMTPADLDGAIRDLVAGEEGGIKDKIVRLVVRDIERHIVRELDHAALRDYKRQALHFQLDTRRPDITRMLGGETLGRRPSLAEMVRQKLESRIIEGDIDRAALVELGLSYLRDADAVEATAGVSASIEEQPA
jgi:DNA repair protein SbcD/Mre11